MQEFLNIAIEKEPETPASLDKAYHLVEKIPEDLKTSVYDLPDEPIDKSTQAVSEMQVTKPVGDETSKHLPGRIPDTWLCEFCYATNYVKGGACYKCD